MCLQHEQRGFVECKGPESLQEICATIRCRTHTENSGLRPLQLHVRPVPFLSTQESGSPESVWVCKSLTGSSVQPGLRRRCLSQEALLCHLMMWILVYFLGSISFLSLVLPDFQNNSIHRSYPSNRRYSSENT